MNRAQTVTQIRARLDKAERMNCRDILDLIETIDYCKDLFEKIQRESCAAGEDFGNAAVERLARLGLEAVK